ncbi:MAG: hypothetical protein Ct9H300mP4_06300 [Gammaproteobacteria bacterium]|nr:MAG: hypothetical protein Ct9H300mP4_06300 [Gammaproteobacteria bacterium]
MFPKDNSKGWERSKKILNLLADRVETVTPWLVEQTLNNKKNGPKNFLGLQEEKSGAVCFLDLSSVRGEWLMSGRLN